MGLIVQERVNLFVGDDATFDSSKHLNLDSIKLPDLEELTEAFHAGGAIGAIEVGGMGLKALESSFKLKGWDAQAMSAFGLNSRNQYPFTVYGVARDKNGNRAIEVKAIIRARMTRVQTEDIKQGSLMGHDFMLREVLHYELYFDKVEKYWMDWRASEWRVDGVSQTDTENSILRIPTGL